MSFVEGVFVLPADVRIREPNSADALPKQLGSGYLLISRPGGRLHPRLIPREAADILGYFREPSFVETAILKYCDECGGSPADVLSSLVPLFCDLMNQGYLVPPDSPGARSVEPGLHRGQAIGRFDVVHCMRANVDTEVYLVRNRSSREPAVMKIESLGRVPGAATAISREADLLEELGGGIAPRLIDRGELTGLSYVLMDWCEGRKPEEFASASRHSRNHDTRRRALDICCQILDAYVRLHDRGILHGDVQPTNILIPDQGPARIIDFGSAVRMGDMVPVANFFSGRADPYIEPELAAASVQGTEAPLASIRGEQYLVAAVLYRILTGSTHLRLSLIESVLLRQIAASEVRPFSGLGHPPWPELEKPLARALHRDPEARFERVGDLLREFDAVRSGSYRLTRKPPYERFTTEAERIAEQYADLPVRQEDWKLPNEGLSEGLDPTVGVHESSLAYGSGGVALGLLHIAATRSEPRLMASADVWLTRALRLSDAPHISHGEQTGPEAPIAAADVSHTLDVPPLGPVPESAGADVVSLYLGAPGLYLAESLLAASSGNWARTRRSATHFVSASGGPSIRLELFGGRAGTLLGLSLLRRTCHEHFGRELAELRSAGDGLYRAMVQRMEDRAPIWSAGPENLGIAHGWGGVLYSLIHWLHVSGRPLESPIGERLEELADQAVPHGDSLRWPWVARGEAGDIEILHSAGWCNGNAGLVQLWLLAHDVEPDDRYLERAIASARALESEQNIASHLCCGASGFAYALLRLFCATQDELWLERARWIIERSISALPGGLERQNRASLFRGELGIAVVASEFAAPGDARMPAFS
jgi:serine/threonine-protein kinase